MGWNTGAVLVENADESELLRDLEIYELGERRLYLEGAISQLAIGRVGSWSIFWSAALHDDELVRDLSRGRRAFAFLASGVRSTYGFDWIANGATIRRVVYRDGRAIVSEGAELDAETGIEVPPWGRDESFILTVMKRLTGVSDLDLDEATYRQLLPIGGDLFDDQPP